MPILESQRNIANKYNLPPCIYQTSAGKEAPCCSWKWNWVINGAATAAIGLATTKAKTGVSTACIPNSMGEACEEGLGK